MDRYESKEVLRAWKLFAGAFAAWLFVVLVVAWLLPSKNLKSADFGLEHVWYFGGLIVLGLMLLAAALVTVVWLFQNLWRWMNSTFRRMS